MSLDTHFLFASLIWGSIGIGFSVYGKKQKEWVTWLGGIALVAISYFIDSAIYMSLAGVILVAAIVWLRLRG
jgi:hypothetical protein